MPHTFVISDESVNNYGFWVLTAGIDIEQFKRNPIMLWMHSRPTAGFQSEVLPIGKWENIRVENNQLLADAVFDTEDDFAKKIESKVNQGIIRMASPGLEPFELSDNVEHLKFGQTRSTVVRSALKEISIVDRGANNNALKLYNSDGGVIELSDSDSTIIPFINNLVTMKLTDSTLKLLELTDKASEQDINLAISTLAGRAAEEAKKTEQTELKLTEAVRERDELKQQLNAKAKADFEILLNDPKRKLTAEQKAHYVKLFEVDAEIAKKTIEMLPTAISLHDVPEQGSAEELKLADEWDKLHKDGKLSDLQNQNPERYATLKKAKYGK